MAGWKTTQITSAMPGMLNLATAAGAELGRTADIVSDNMTAMGLEAGKTIRTGKNLEREVEASAHFMDVYAYAMSNSNVNLETLGETMKYAAPIAAAYGATLEDTAAMSMIMGNAGIKGSMAGTSLRMGLLRLSGPPKKATKEMEELGISLSDATAAAYETEAQLKALGINLDQNATPADKMFQVLTQLSEKTKDLSEEEQLAAVSAIFGANAASGWVNVLKQGPEVFKKYRDELRECDGFAQQFADTMKDNAEGAMIAFDSAVDAVSNTIGTAFLPIVRKMAERGAAMAGNFAEWASKHQALVQWAGLLAAGLSGVIVAAAGVQLAFAGWAFISSSVGLVTAGVSALTARIAAMTAVQKLAAAASAAWTGIQWALNAAMLANPIGLIVAAVAALVGLIALVIYNCDGLRNALLNAWNDPAGAVTGFTNLIKSSINDAVEYVLTRWETLKQALSHPLDAVMNFIDTGSVIGGEVKSGESIRATQKAHENVGGGLGAIQNQVVEIDTGKAQAQVDGLGNAAEQNAQTIQSVNQNMTSTGEGLSQIQNAVQPAVEGIANHTGAITANNEVITQVNTNYAQNSELLTANNTQIQTNTAELTNFSAGLQSTNGGLQFLASNSSGAAGSIQSLGTAAQYAISQMQSAASAASAKVASNAGGGIYPKGAFLTTFAEESPEAAIPLDGSERAKSLWQRAGQMLGLLPGNGGNFDSKSTIGKTNIGENLLSTFPMPQSMNIPNFSFAGEMPKQIFSGGVNLPDFNRPDEGILTRLLDKIGSGQSSTNAPISINFSITVNGNSNSQDVERGVRQAIPDIEGALKSILQNRSRDSARRSYA